MNFKSIGRVCALLKRDDIFTHYSLGELRRLNTFLSKLFNLIEKDKIFEQMFTINTSTIFMTEINANVITFGFKNGLKLVDICQFHISKDVFEIQINQNCVFNPIYSKVFSKDIQLLLIKYSNFNLENRFYSGAEFYNFVET